MTTPKRGQMIWFKPPLSNGEWAGRVMSEMGEGVYEVFATIAPPPGHAKAALIRVFETWILPNEGRSILCECCGDFMPPSNRKYGEVDTAEGPFKAARDYETASRHTNNWRPTKLHEDCLAQYMRQTGREVRHA